MNNITYQGHIPRKDLGQYFLIDRYIIDNIVAAINPQNGQAMVEIGPGLAALTEPVSQYVEQLYVVELDANLAKRLQMDPILGSKLVIYQQDVMNLNFSCLSQKLGQSLRIFGNLPYRISTSLIFYLFRYIDIINDMHFMLQKEVVNRLIAGLNSKEYGRLSIMVQYYCRVVSILEVSPCAFIPSPNVNSVLVRLIPYTNAPYPVKNMNLLSRITAEAFNQRRKKISNSLRNLFSIEELTMLEIDPNMRAENISVAEYCKMSNYLSNKY